MSRDYYCSQKFNYLELNLVDGQAFSCCAATPYQIKVKELENNPTNFFNWPEIVKDRQDMIENKRTASCEYCWKNEDKGILSRRLQMNSHHKTHSDLQQIPEYLSVILSTNCNQACVYCNGVFSTSWGKIINEHASEYATIKRAGNNYIQTNKQKILNSLSQKEKYKSKYVNLLLEQIKAHKSNYKKVVISGGEPLLDNNLFKFLDIFRNTNIRISITSGLTVSKTRLKSVINKIKELNLNLEFYISAENINEMHEFNRYGSKFNQFLENLEFIKKDFSYNFMSTIGCTTIFGFSDFLQQFPNDLIISHSVSYPSFLQLYNMDDESKELVIGKLNASKFVDKQKYIEIIEQPANPLDVVELQKFVPLYARSRNLDLSIFPQSFQNFLQQKG